MDVDYVVMPAMILAVGIYSGRSSAVPFSPPNAYALIAQPSATRKLRFDSHGVSTREAADPYPGGRR
jgi:hypothetical protein